MVKTLILTQGGLAEVLLAAVHKINGETPHLAALSLDWDDDLRTAAGKTRRAIERLGPEDGLLILTDMYGGTPYRVAADFREPGRVEVLTGANLPMLLRLGCQVENDGGVEALRDRILEKGRRSISSAAPKVADDGCS